MNYMNCYGGVRPELVDVCRAKRCKLSCHSAYYAGDLKRARVRTVLGWVTSWKVLVRQAADVAPLDLVVHVGCKSVIQILTGNTISAGDRATVEEDCGRYRQSGPRPEMRLLRQPALEGLTRSARTDSPRRIGRKQFSGEDGRRWRRTAGGGRRRGERRGGAI
ncbi:hypothetical protein F511_13757 [Dorcoceras hygrometricum]|uniref:Uncharacterized protein n=1 Tax=Dorcoceras hygrometricum TaxID=472368 RepID=A0A2Z7CUK1_9LAMI|nr:hypothetical protein F511_13757 [Dorcoceras hygrometricum]